MKKEWEKVRIQESGGGIEQVPDFPLVLVLLHADEMKWHKFQTI